MQTGTELAHKMLELLITKAAISGRSYTSEVALSYDEIARGMGQSNSSPHKLNIEIKVSWAKQEKTVEADDE